MTLPSSLAEALRRTQSGDLTGATALIRAALGGGADRRPIIAPLDVVIDLKSERTVDAPRPRDATARRGCFEERVHDGPAGRLAYMLYRPQTSSPGMPLVIMLHGCTQSPEDFAAGTGMNRLAEELGFLVAYPRQTQAANQQRCWNWFRAGDQVRGRGEPALIAGVTQDVIRMEDADATRVYVAGLSAGGAAAAIMADTYPDLFAAAGVHSGLPAGAARNLPGALSAMKQGAAFKDRRKIAARFVPLITFHGDRDGTVNEANACDLVAAATAAAGVSIKVETETGVAGGRSFARALSRNADGRVLIEQWTVAGAGHAWSGGDTAGSYADAAGPNASREMLRFFLDQRHAAE
ncbi:extracellular catalytic domain type 1 short-chain-length polyhydroxyalkanoate depolymerase [Sphingomonas sp. 8AM]|uniref:extracellular catalytic domain type 1 short-chain-length polyhydroxyalkanoate depolymerase n=1 Tax=Sphingomonas sp. 8AM TaxID=2653170 RepID=UPI0012F1F1EA|nr:PHB depolymerase family esterase [Sphingomonas sp. 8AM]VXC92760.1 Esterase, PHB depolymerase family [Sphingomonas sp. 8AM]